MGCCPILFGTWRRRFAGAGHRAAGAHGIDTLLDADLNDQAERLAQAMINLLVSGSGACPSRIRCQAATGSWTKSRQWETQRTLFSSARATMCLLAKVNGGWPFNDAWLRTSL